MLKTADVSSFFLSRQVISWLAWLLLTLASPLHAANLLVVTSHSSQPYLQTLNQLQHNLDRQAWALRSVTAAELKATTLEEADLVLPLGVDALVRVLESGQPPPTLAVMIPKVSFQSLVQQYQVQELVSQGRLSALYLEQPYQRQLQLARILLPNARQLGALLGPSSDTNQAALTEAAARLHFDPLLVPLGEEDNPLSVIRGLVDVNDLLLALPDKPEFTRNTAKWLLLLSLREQVPLIGFSRGYVDAGALAAVYSSPASIGAETGQKAARWLTTQKLPAPGYPAQFELSLNPTIANQLGIRLPTEDDLRNRLLEAQP